MGTNRNAAYTISATAYAEFIRISAFTGIPKPTPIAALNSSAVTENLPSTKCLPKSENHYREFATETQRYGEKQKN